MTVTRSKLPSRKRLRELFDYHEDGYLIRKSTGKRVAPGNGKYVRLVVDGVSIDEHRVIFAWHHGYFPPQVDHRDRTKRNNRIGNLVPSDYVHNANNKGPNKGNRLGVRGVTQSPDGKFHVRRTIAGLRRYRGSYCTLTEAAKAAVEMNYDEALRLARHGHKMVRPHWCWIYLSSSECRADKLALFDEPTGHERDLFKPTRSDRKATDWMVAP